MGRMSQEKYVINEHVAHLSLLVKMENVFKVTTGVTVLISVGIIQMKKNAAVSWFCSFHINHDALLVI